MTKATILLAAAMILTTPSFSASKNMTGKGREKILEMLTVKKQKPLAETAFIKGDKKEKTDSPSAPKKNPAQELPLSVFVLPEETRVPKPEESKKR